jgi:hypothetical protein
MQSEGDVDVDVDAVVVICDCDGDRNIPNLQNTTPPIYPIYIESTAPFSFRHGLFQSLSAQAPSRVISVIIAGKERTN